MNDRYHGVLYDAMNAGISKNCLKLFLQAFPEGCMKQDENGMVPLHYAWASCSPNFHEYIIALLDIQGAETLWPIFLTSSSVF
jgi:hypothetical protein